MAWFVSVFLIWFKAIPSFFMNLFLYIFLFLGWLHYRKQTLFERKLFHRRVNHPWRQWSQMVFHGIWGGVLASFILFVLGVQLRPFDFWAIAALSLLLSLINIQYLSFAYAGGLYVLLVTVVKLWPGGSEIHALEWIWTQLVGVDLPSLIGLIALLYVMKAILVRRNRGQGAMPLVLNGRRGRSIGAYYLQKFWLLPIFIVVAAPTESIGIGSLPWWPLLASGEGIQLTLIGVPVMLGFSDLMLSKIPEEKAIDASKKLFLYGITLILCAIMSKWLLWIGMFSGILALFGHSFFSHTSRWKNKEKPLLFTPSGDGAVVLAVFPGTPADIMGILRGEVIIKVNDQKIIKSEDLYPALQLNSAFCRMEVRNLNGHIKYVQKSLYEGEHHQLGLTLAPDEHATHYVDLKRSSIFHLFR